MPGKDRLIATIGMMGASTSDADATGVNAYRQATRMLGEQGMTWRDVADLAFGDGAARRGPIRPAAAAAPASRGEPAPDGRPREKTRHQGNDIPVTIVGTIRLLDDERRARASRMMLIEIETEDSIYGPMTAHAGPLMDNVIKSGGKRAVLRVRPAREGRDAPQVVGCSPI